MINQRFIADLRGKESNTDLTIVLSRLSTDHTSG
jgi:hypothetical protein